MRVVPELLKRRACLADPALRQALERAVRRRVRADDADDIVQATLADVLSAADVPGDPDELRRFVFGVARNKVFDHFRRKGRELPDDGVDELAQPEPPLSARDILRWAEGELSDAASKQTFEWLLREGDGEKLEHIARDANLPAPRVRQRVSRLRRFLRERWAAELMLAGLSVCLLLGAAWYLLVQRRTPHDIATPERVPLRPMNERARELRRLALERCRAGDATGCVRELDRAKRLDPAGDAAAEIVAARRAARSPLAPLPSAPVPSSGPVPSNTSAPSVTPAPRVAPRRGASESSLDDSSSRHYAK